MMRFIKEDYFGNISVALYLFFSIWWLCIQMAKLNVLYFLNLDQSIAYFGALYGVSALWGGIVGLLISKEWGAFKSVIGRTLIFFAIGLLAQEFGQIVYTYYVYVLHVEVPYPSLGDLGYFGSIPLYICAVISLSKASGVHIGLKSAMNKIQAVIIPLVMLALSYIVFLQDYQFDWSRSLSIFFDFAYPMGQAIYLSLAILTFLLTRNVLGGSMKKVVLFIIFALFIQYLSDYTFLYQVSREIWSEGGINEFMYLTSYSLMTISLLKFRKVYSDIKRRNK